MKHKQTTNYKTLTFVLFGLIVLIILGNVAKGFNEAHHEAMALKACKSKENIQFVNSKSFACKREVAN